MEDIYLDVSDYPLYHGSGIKYIWLCRFNPGCYTAPYKFKLDGKWLRRIRKRRMK